MRFLSTRRLAVVFALLLSHSMHCGSALATDYFLTIGGGYHPRGNQASLEANVLFFSQVLEEEHGGARNQAVFFADGYDDTADLQVLKPQSTPGPVTQLLQQLHSRGGSSGGSDVEYRNHQVPSIAGPISPKPIANSLRRSAASMQSGDRLIIYVTAHGEPAKGENKFNTFVSCWDGEKFSAVEFSEWLSKVPADVPVIMVMAQCYCGGFAHTIFEAVDSDAGLADHLRCGFFAQQHNLAAAGCRPDIENDEEYSSFFWGAFAGRSRNGREFENIDCNHDGKVSFAEAHAQAVIVSETIDIPLRTSETLLRHYSRIAGYEHRGLPKVDKAKRDADERLSDPADTENLLIATHNLNPMSGSIRHLSDQARPDIRRIVVELSRQLGLALDDDVSRVFEEYSKQSKEFAEARRANSRSRRSRDTGRRELREEIGNQWPELADRRRWRSSDILKDKSETELFEKIQQLPSYAKVAEYLKRRAEGSAALELAELRDVKFQRLINTLEMIVLEQNLSFVADPEIVGRFLDIMRVEESHLTAH